SSMCDIVCYYTIDIILCMSFLYCLFIFFFFFFFQAEDGIRDGHVTGVQTCALPICPAPHLLLFPAVRRLFLLPAAARRDSRADEIGRASCRKECRSRWSAYH